MYARQLVRESEPQFLRYRKKYSSLLRLHPYLNMRLGRDFIHLVIRDGKFCREACQQK